MTGYGDVLRAEWEQSTQAVVFDAVRRLTPGVSWSIVGTGGGCEALETYIAPTDNRGRAVGRPLWRVWVTDNEGASFDTFGPYSVGLYDDRDPESGEWTGEETAIADGVALEDLAAQLVVFGRKAAEVERDGVSLLDMARRVWVNVDAAWAGHPRSDSAVIVDESGGFVVVATGDPFPVSVPGSGEYAFTVGVYSLEMHRTGDGGAWAECGAGDVAEVLRIMDEVWSCTSLEGALQRIVQADGDLHL